MGTAMHFALEDIRHAVGMHSDGEERAEEDGEYDFMSKYLSKANRLKKSDSDQSFLNKTGSGQHTEKDNTRGEQMLQVSIFGSFTK